MRKMPVVVCMGVLLLCLGGAAASAATYVGEVVRITSTDNEVVAQYGKEFTFEMQIETADIASGEHSTLGYDTEALVVYFHPILDEPQLFQNSKKQRVLIVFRDEEQYLERIPEQFRGKIKILQSIREWK